MSLRGFPINILYLRAHYRRLSANCDANRCTNPAGRSFLRFAFCGDVDDHRPQQALDKGIVRAVWLSPAELQSQPARLRSPLVMRCIDDFLAGKRQPLDSVACLDLESALHVPSVVNL